MTTGQQQSVINNKSQMEKRANPILNGPNNPPMAVLPLNSSAKLDQEPNPFEQSFSGVQLTDKDKKESKLTLPPVASITSTSTKPVVAPAVNPIIGGGILPKEVTNQFTWDSLRTGPLSPSMLQGPANPDEYYAAINPNLNHAANINHPAIQYNRSFAEQPNKAEKIQPNSVPQPYAAANQRKRSSCQYSEDSYSLESCDSHENNTNTRRLSNKETLVEEEGKTNKKTKSRSPNKNVEDDAKRKSFLERNRIAALKCRQRKKQWLTDLQSKVEYLTTDNERLQLQSESLKEEIVNLKTLLLAHKECPVAQANGFHVNALQKTMPSMMSAQTNVSRTMSSMIPHPAASSPPPPAYIHSGLATHATTSLPPPSNTPITSSTHPIPQYQSTNMMSTQLSQQQGMIAGGPRASSGILHF
jgi:hypothetical protein